MGHKMRSFSSLDKVQSESNGLDWIHTSYRPHSWDEHEKMRWGSVQMMDSQDERTPSIKKMLQKRSRRKSFFRNIFRSSKSKNFKRENSLPRMKLHTDSIQENHIPSHCIVPKKNLNMMQVVLTSIAYIEQNGGLLSRGLYRDREELSLDKVQQCADVMIQSESITSSEFSRFTDVRIVAAALKHILTTCELVPYNVIPSIMEITDGSEIEELIASPEWDALKGNTFLALLRHLANVARFEVSNDMSSLELGNIFGDILLREQKMHLETQDQDAASFKSKGRRIALIIRYMADEGKSQLKNNACSGKEIWRPQHQSPGPSTNNEAREDTPPAKPSDFKEYHQEHSSSKTDKKSHKHDNLEAKKPPQTKEDKQRAMNFTDSSKTRSGLSSSPPISVTGPICGRFDSLYDRHDTIVRQAQLRIMNTEALLQRPIGNTCDIGRHSLHAENRYSIET